jgi:hypothetical protein
MPQPASPLRRLPLLWRLVHWAIVLNLLFEFLYAGYQVFVVYAPEGGGVLGARAREMPLELMVPRRLYAIEAWLAFGALAIYLAITEIGPRAWRSRGA